MKYNVSWDDLKKKNNHPKSNLLKFLKIDRESISEYKSPGQELLLNVGDHG